MTRSTPRRHFLVAIAAFSLAACGGGSSGSGGNAESLVDMAMGPETAPAVLVEYASTVCGVCANYNATMHETIEQLTSEGKLRFILREFPNGPVDIAGFATARCAGEDKYYDVVGDLFENQRGILTASRNGTVKTALQTIAARHGVDATRFEACLASEDIKTAISSAAEYGQVQGVAGTPALFLNNVQLEGADGRTPESLIALVEELQ